MQNWLSKKTEKRKNEKKYRNGEFNKGLPGAEMRGMRDNALWNGILIGFGVCCCFAAAMLCFVPRSEGVFYIIVTVGIISPAIAFAYEFYQRDRHFSDKQGDFNG